MEHSILVMKFGGTSVADIPRIQHVARRIENRRKEGHSIVVVVSAMGRETDRLLSLASQVSKHPDKRELDMLLTAGERITMALLAMTLKDGGIPAISFTGSQSGIITDTKHNRAKIVTIQATRIEAELEQHKVVIVAGFQGVSREKEVTTLGRGGSDTSAVALAAALKATRCEIYTDVSGVFAIDPRIIPGAEKILRISYDEMIEFAGAGSKILEARSVIFARNFNIPLWIGTSFDDEEGTMIDSEGAEIKKPVCGIAINAKECVLTFQGIKDSALLQNVLLELCDNNVPLELLYQSLQNDKGTDFSFAFPESDYEQALKIGDRLMKESLIEDRIIWESLARISIIGRGMKGVPGITVQFLGALRKAGIPSFIITTSDMRISAFIPRKMVNIGTESVARAFQLI